jgi:dTDP-4-amino-4,6-dideoxygalactose transaminase
MKVNFLDLKAQYQSIKPEIDEAIQKVLDSSAFAAGPFVKQFEENFAKAHNASFCVGVNSGTAALHAALMAFNIGPGDQVIVPANTFFATPEAVSLAGATPIFVDCEKKFFNIDPEKIEAAITPKTKAIIAVHLYGQPSDMNEIVAIAKKHGLYVIEDCAQAHLAQYKGKYVGTFGDCGCFSFYPGKNLGAYGEGGGIITNNEDLYKKLMMIRDHGMPKKYHHEIIGHNYRMEGMQGAILDVKLRHLEKWTEIRRQNASYYQKYLKGIEIGLPQESPDAKHVYHLYVIQTENRDHFMERLKDHEIFTGIHYPIPCHLQNAYKSLGYKPNSFQNTEHIAQKIVSLPMSEQLTEEQIEYVADTIRSLEGV